MMVRLYRQSIHERKPTPVVSCFLGLVIVLSLVSWLQADPSLVSREYKIKAAYLYNFAKYVTWPADFLQGRLEDQSEFLIGILGSSPIDAPLQTIASQKTVQGMPIRILHFGSVEELEDVHILFISRELSHHSTREAVDRIDNQPTLIVGESDRFADDIGMVNFWHVDNRLRFEINRSASSRAGLKISSKLLSVGKVVD